MTLFSIFKRKPKLEPLNYSAEFRLLVRKVEDQFSVGNSPYEQLVDSMVVIEREMNFNGGGNWVEDEFIEFLDTIRDILLAEPQFSGEQRDKIRWALNEIIECGRELKRFGESRRGATEAVNYLIERVVDWCRLHPRTFP